MNSNNFEKKKIEILNFFKQKRFIEVTKLGADLIHEFPDDYQLIYILGLASINTKNFVDAEKYFEKLISVKESHEIYYIYGNILKKLKKFDKAVSSLENAIKLNPNFSEAYNSLGNAKKSLNKRDDAENHYRKAISLKENNIEALFNLSAILRENLKYKDLIDVYEKILKIDQKNIKTIYNLGSAHLFIGDIIKGREYFEKAIEIDGYHIPSFRNYISVTKINKQNKIFKKLLNINIEKLDNENKTLMFSALSKGYFDMDNIDFGFEYLNKSNLIKKENSKFSLNDEEKKFINIKNFFLNLKNLDFKFNNHLESKPIFIVGMPRSGTSILEQILSSHSKIYGAGELNFLQKIIDNLGIVKPDNIKDYFFKIRSFYYGQISQISKKKYIIDKLPVNFRWIGFILKSFPEAKVIHIYRNPMAVCWSNYKTHFVDVGMDFNLSQQDVAHYYSLYLKLMEFWEQQFKGKIFHISYEKFVQDYESNTKKILSFLDLEWEDEMRNYENNDRVVTTASYQQVREKIKKNTSNEWKKYKDHLLIMQETLKSKQIDF